MCLVICGCSWTKTSTAQRTMQITRLKTQCLPTQSTDKVLDRYEERRTDNGYGFNITKLTDIAGKAIEVLCQQNHDES